MSDFAQLHVTIGGTDVLLMEVFKGYLGMDVLDTSKDTELAIALNYAGDAIETYLDRVVAKRSVDEYFPHHFGTVVLHEPIVDASVDPVVTLNGTVVSGYSLYLGRGRIGNLSRNGIRPDIPMDWRAFDQVIVTYTAGYDPLPSDLANALVMTAALFYQSAGTGLPPSSSGGSGTVKSVTVYDVGSVSYDVSSTSTDGSGSGMFGSAGIIPDPAAQMLTRYKRIAA